MLSRAPGTTPEEWGREHVRQAYLAGQVRAVARLMNVTYEELSEDG